MDLKKLTDKAKDLVDKRGGTDNLKEDAEELKGIAGTKGSFADKAKAAVAAIKDPGDDGTTPPAADTPQGVPAEPGPAADATEAEVGRAEDKVAGEHRGKHARGAGGGGGGDGDGRGRGHGRGGRGGGGRAV